MTDRRRCRLAALAILAATAGATLAAPAPALAQHPAELTRVELFPLRPAATGQAPAVPIMALLNLPASWTVLDAAAILVDDPAWPAGARDRLRTALLDQGASVLELDPRAVIGRRDEAGTDSTFAAQPADPPDLLAGLFGALLALREDAGAGLVVAFGHGAAGEAALAAAEEATAARHLGPAGPRFTALGKVGPGRPDFVIGAAPAEAEQWPLRAPLLCALVADAVPEATRGDCLAALRPRRRNPDTAPGPLAQGR